MDMDQVYRQAELDDQADAAFGIDNVTRRVVQLDDEDAF
jgi:hypothetical protein